MVQDIHRALEEKDARLLHRAAHTLKGSIRLFEAHLQERTFVLGDRLVRTVIRWELTIACRDRARAWRILQELAGTENAYARRAADEARLAARREAESEAERREAEFAAEIESAREREKRMSQDIFTLRNEREDFKAKVAEISKALVAVRQQTSELQAEFMKSREFYKGELTKAFERRKDIEEKLERARAEQESFSTLLESSQSEHESVNKMLASAQKRLGQMDILEQDVIRLEAENAQLNHDATLAKQEIETLRRDITEMDELRVQNKELAEVLKSMENSRKQYESDARRYKETAESAEKK